MLKNKRLLLLSLLLVILGGVVLGIRVGYPHHRLIAVLFWLAGWGPLIISYRHNQQLIRTGKILLKRKGKPYTPHAILAGLLLLALYIGWVLVPIESCPLIKMPPGKLQDELNHDFGTYLMLRATADDLVQTLNSNGLLQRDVDTLTKPERREIRRLWRDGIMAFVEGDMLKSKYRGFMQIDYKVQPKLHSDAFFMAYASYICQYDACLKICEMVDENRFMETLLNEAGEGIPADSYFVMKQRLTHPEVILRLNAGNAYYELVKQDMSVPPELKRDFEARRTSFFKRQSKNPDLFIKNPLDVLERQAFKAWFPVQKNIAVQMSHIRTAHREYFITPEILADYRDLLHPGDILLERRNWHMTNIGIPGFWPHAALYVGTLQEIDMAFDQLNFRASEKIKLYYPEIYAALQRQDESGYPLRVLESIRPGVILQSLEKSANCDYLGVVRPNLTQTEKFNALLAAFAHYKKPYDLNFDFTTDNALVCSELIYKAYRSSGKLPLEPEVINGRLLLPPNQMAKQMIDHDDLFSFVFFLDANEKTDQVIKGTYESFSNSWARPKWDIMQK